MRSANFGSEAVPPAAVGVITAFHRRQMALAVPDIRRVTEVLDMVRGDLVIDGWEVAAGARREHGVPLTATPGVEISADGWHPSGAALWIETGRTWTNNAFLVHAIEAAMVPSLGTAVLAVREVYSGTETFERCAGFLGAMWRSERFHMPYESLILIGF